MMNDLHILLNNVAFVEDARSGNFTTLELVAKHNFTPVQIRTFMYRNGMSIKREVAVDVNFFRIMTQELAYVLGWLASDGCVSDTGSISLKLQATDKSIIQYLARLMAYTNKIGERSDVDKRNQTISDAVSLSFTSREVADILLIYGIGPRKSLVMQYPTTISDRFKKSYIRGIMDGDGYIVVGKSTSVGFIGTHDVINGLRHDISRLARIDPSAGCIVPNGIMWTLTYGGSFLTIKILDWIYHDCGENRLERKYARYLELKTRLEEKGLQHKEPIQRRNSDDNIKVAKLDKATEAVIEIFTNRRLAADNVKRSYGDISRVCNGINKSCGGYKWRFVRDKDE